MPRYFRKIEYRSFLRQLNLYGFVRSSSRGPYEGHYVHDYFRRDEPSLCRKMLSKRAKNYDANQSGLHMLECLFPSNSVGPLPSGEFPNIDGWPEEDIFGLDGNDSVPIEHETAPNNDYKYLQHASVSHGIPQRLTEDVVSSTSEAAQRFAPEIPLHQQVQITEHSSPFLLPEMLQATVSASPSAMEGVWIQGRVLEDDDVTTPSDSFKSRPCSLSTMGPRQE